MYPIGKKLADVLVLDIVRFLSYAVINVEGTRTLNRA